MYTYIVFINNIAISYSPDPPLNTKNPGSAPHILKHSARTPVSCYVKTYAFVAL